MREVNMDNVTYGYKEVDGKKEIDYEKWIDLSGLPKKNGKCNRLNWMSSIGSVVRFRYKNINDILNIVDYKSGVLYIKYKNNVYDIKYNNFKNCNLGAIIGEVTSEFKMEIGGVFKDKKRELIIVNREYRRDKKGQRWKWYKYKCNKCDNEDWMSEGNLFKYGCNTCGESPRKAKLGLNTIWDKARWMIDLGVSEEDAKKHTPGSGKEVLLICPDCGELKKIKLGYVFKKRNISCICGDGVSYPEKFIYSMLKQLDLEFETEVKYDWNKYINTLTNKESQAYIDFVIYHNEREIPVEADGGFHRKNNDMSGQTKKMSEDIDKQRDENCLKYLGEETIRITDEGDIKENILNSKLSELFDLSNVDWNKCEEFALSNLVKEVCECWNNKEEWETTGSLASKFNLSRRTILNYLKRGLKLGWCNYDPKKEKCKSSSKNGKLFCKRVEIFNKQGVSLGVFSSASELEKQSEKLFGIKLINSSISLVARGKQNHHKGYKFKYIEENQNIAC